MSLLPSFPSSPTNGQVATVGDYSYTYNSTTDSWEGVLGGSSGSGNFAQVFTSSGTFTVPTGVSAVKVTVIGGGGGGSGGNQVPCGGGGGGGVAVRWVTGLTPGGTVAVTVGAGGTAGTGNGGSGGTSSFGSYASATGGAGGTSTFASVVSPQSAGGVGSNGDLNITGGSGGIGVSYSGEFDGTSYAGGGGGSSGESGSSGYLARAASSTTGTRPFGGGAGYLGGRGGDGGIQTINSINFTVGQAGTGWGNGGSGLAYGTTSAQSGGAGSPGIVLVEWSASVLVITSESGGLGYDQSWTDVSGSRNFGVTYTNTTGKPIQILVGAGTSGVGGGVFVTINGVTLPAVFAYSPSVGTASACAIVPVGATYSASAYGSASYASWHELR